MKRVDLLLPCFFIYFIFGSDSVHGVFVYAICSQKHPQPVLIALCSSLRRSRLFPPIKVWTIVKASSPWSTLPRGRRTGAKTVCAQRTNFSSITVGCPASPSTGVIRSRSLSTVVNDDVQRCKDNRSNGALDKPRTIEKGERRRKSVGKMPDESQSGESKTLRERRVCKCFGTGFSVRIKMRCRSLPWPVSKSACTVENI